MRAITYARVATIGPERGESPLDGQERACLDFAESRGWDVVESIREVGSGLSTSHSGIERVRHLLRSGSADILVACSLDRLARDPRKLVALVDEIECVGAALE